MMWEHILYMKPSTAQMDAVVILARLEGKFKEEDIDASSAR